MSRDWRTHLIAGMSPPTLLRLRAVQAEEVLILSYTADMRFFERVALPEARAVGARVTVVHDDDADLVPASEVFAAGVHYTDVPVRCRSDGEFHPKLVVAVGADSALVAIGSGNATASGWHHNGELWVTLAADSHEWPTTFHQLADWLTDLPGLLHIDAFGAERIASTAAALSRHPAAIDGPQLVHNLRAPIIDQLPLAGHVDQLSIASPFLDSQASALRRVSAHFGAERVTLMLTDNAQADAQAVADWAEETGANVHAIDDSRYFHGKLLQWTGSNGMWAVVGSPNVTAAAMLRTTGQTHGNCELAVLCQPTHDLTPALGAALGDAEQIAGQLSPAVPPPGRDGGQLRLLRVLAGERAIVTIVGDAEDCAGARLLAGTGSYELRLTDAGRWVHQLTVDVPIVGGALCTVELADGRRLGPVRATDPVAVVTRPGSVSPLEDARLTQVLATPRLSAQLFDALEELATLRPPDRPGGGSHGGSASGRWRRAAERAVGSALIALALGVPSGGGLGEQPEIEVTEVDAGAAAAEDGDDEGLFDTETAETDTGVFDPLDAATDPVSTLVADPVTAAAIARRLTRRVRQLEGWSTPALLALLRVTLIVAAGGGWQPPPSLDAAAVVARVLYHLVEADETDDDDLEAARDAGALVGLAALSAAIDSWEQHDDEPLVAGYEEIRSRAELDPVSIDQGRVAHFCADLDIGYGALLSTDGIMDAASFLAESNPLQRQVEALETELPNVRLAAPRLIEVHTGGNAQTAAMRLLTRCQHLAPIAVRVITPQGGVYAAWQPKTLTMQRTAGTGTAVNGGVHQLAVGPGAHIGAPLPRAQERWSGPIPQHVRDQLSTEGLLGPDARQPSPDANRT